MADRKTLIKRDRKSEAGRRTKNEGVGQSSRCPSRSHHTSVSQKKACLGVTRADKQPMVESLSTIFL